MTTVSSVDLRGPEHFDGGEWKATLEVVADRLRALTAPRHFADEGQGRRRAWHLWSRRDRCQRDLQRHRRACARLPDYARQAPRPGGKRIGPGKSSNTAARPR